MKPEIVAALIAASAALVVAVISLINSILLKRVSAETSREMALMKRHSAQFDAAQKLADTELIKCLGALDSACATTQGLKDEILLFVSNITEHIQAADSIQHMATAALSIGEAFQNELTHLTDHERKVFHGIKVRAHRIAAIAERLQHVDAAATDTKVLCADLMAERDQLTAAQRELIRCRDERIVRRTIRLKVSAS